MTEPQSWVLIGLFTTIMIGVLGLVSASFNRALRTSVDSLKEVITVRFEQVERRFEQVDRRFEQVDRRFEQVERRLDKADERLDRIERRLDGLDADVAAISKRMLE